MKIYNRNLDRINNEQLNKKVSTIMEKQIEFLTKRYGVDENLLRKREKNLAVVERHVNDQSYFREVNGEKVEVPQHYAAAITLIKSQKLEGNQMTFENAIYINPEGNSYHTITHELFHFFSQQEQIYFNEFGEGDYKVGTGISVYNKDDVEVSNSLNARGLNEGVTEFLTSEVTGDPLQAYDVQAYIASILIGHQHRGLINAYFSQDRQAFVDFLKDFDQRQNFVSSQELITMPTQNIELNTDLLKGCTEYAFSFCKDKDEYMAEANRLKTIYKSIENNLNVCCDREVNLRELYSKIATSKKEEIKRKMNAKQNLLSSAVDATETVRIDEINNMISEITISTRENKITQDRGIE